MTKVIPTLLLDHMAGEVTTLATCWKVTLTNGRVYGFTDHTRNIFIEGQMYKSATGYSPTAVETSSMLNVDNLEVEAILNSPDISERDLLAGMWDAAQIEHFIVNWANVTAGRMWLKHGTLGQLTLKSGAFTAEVRGITQAYANRIGESYSPVCRARLGDARCKADLTRYTGGGIVEALGAENRIILDATRTEAGPDGGVAITGISRAARAVVSAPGHTFVNGQSVSLSGIVGVVQEGAPDSSPEEVMQEGSGFGINGYNFTIGDVIAGVSFTIPVDTRLANDNPLLGVTPPSLQYTAYVSGGMAFAYGAVGFYTYGKLTFTSGANINLSMEVKSYATGTIELQLPMPFPIAIGDTYTIVAGCGGRFTEDCIMKFNNGLNFRGEPHLPGVDQIMRVGGPPEGAAAETPSVTAPATESSGP